MESQVMDVLPPATNGRSAPEKRENRPPVSLTIPKILVVGYGNPDREDDGVAWFILQGLAARLARDVSELEYEIDPAGPSPHLAFVLQLLPEIAETMAGYDYVCFIDAHTGAFDQVIRFEEVRPDSQPSSFTHHLNPAACLAMAATLYGHAPRTVFLSIRGYSFGFGQSLSPVTESLAQQAERLVVAWLHFPEAEPRRLLEETQ